LHLSRSGQSQTRKDMNKPPTFLFLVDSLVKEHEADTRR
ncbi:hypothetical protein HNR01_002903, partial [Methylorubrum rhodesianum]|nr:hypothetical protein [Methylorubrum rhodesianum]